MKLSNKITGVTCDSREIKPGYAFVAIQGLQRDGHDFIEDAIERGASHVIIEKPVKIKTNIPIKIVDDSRVALAELAASLFGNPSQHLTTIGVTGTNGKTTSTFLVHQLFKINKIDCGLIGTVDIDTGINQRKALLTTPDAVELQGYLKEMVDANIKVSTMEVSSHGIKLKRIHGIEFDLAIFTNVSKDHFDFHQNFEHYLKIKKSFFEQLSHGSIALINGDDPHSEFISSGIKAKVLTYGIHNDNLFTADNIRKDNITTNYDLIIHKPIETRFTKIEPSKIPIEIKLPGMHNIYNTLGACATGLLLGLKPEQIQKISDFRGIWRRFQVIYNRDFTIIDDCAHNPGSYSAVFETVSTLSYKNLYIINAIRGNRGVQINRDNACTIADKIKDLPNANLIITNCSELVKPDDLVSEKEEKTFLNVFNEHKIKYTHNKNLHPCIDKVLSNVKPNDLILLLGAHAMDKAGDIILSYPLLA